MAFMHRVVASIVLLLVAVPASAGVKNGHFENRGAGNVHWKTCSTWTSAGHVFINSTGGNPCSFLKIGQPNCGSGREAWQSDICIQPGGPGGFATLKFEAQSGSATGMTVTFTLSSGATTTRGIPFSAGWAGHKVSLPIGFAVPTAKVTYRVCGAAAGAALGIDNVSVCWTPTDETTLGPPAPPPCNCSVSACPGIIVEVKTGPPPACIGLDICICSGPAPEPPAPLAERISATLSAWGPCEDCPQDIWPRHEPDGVVDERDLQELLSSHTDS